MYNIIVTGPNTKLRIFLQCTSKFIEKYTHQNG